MALTKASNELPSEESVLDLDALEPLPWLVLSPLLEDSVDMFELVDFEYPLEEVSAASGIDGRKLRHAIRRCPRWPVCIVTMW